MKNILMKGFTLVEVLIVMAIIGILIVFIVIAVGTANKNSRDSKRLSDTKELQRVLELYKADNGSYPPLHNANSTTFSCDGSDKWCELEKYLNGTYKGTKYMDKLPRDPLYPKTTHYYFYDSDSGDNNNSYVILTKLEYSKNASKMTNDGGVSDGWYEIGPQVQYCYKKYTTTIARNSYNDDGSNLCYGGL